MKNILIRMLLPCSIFLLLFVIGLNHQNSAYTNDRSSVAAFNTTSGLDEIRAREMAKLYILYAMGEPFSGEETKVLRRFVCGQSISDVEADTVKSRVLYNKYILKGRLTQEQEELLADYEAIAPQSGYRIVEMKVRGRHSDAVVESEPNNRMEQANSNANNLFSGSLAEPAPSTDVDLYAFSAMEKAIVALSFDGSSTGTGAVLEVLDSFGSPLKPIFSIVTDASSLASEQLLIFSPPKAGTYYAKVSAPPTFSASIGSYRLAIDLLINKDSYKDGSSSKPKRKGDRANTNGSRSVFKPLASVSNGGFEIGDFSDWDISTTCGGGSWFMYTGVSSPLSGTIIGEPPQGQFGAVTDQTEPGTFILSQDIPLEASSRHTLSFKIYYNNLASEFFTPNSLDCSGDFANQQYRVDIVNPDAQIDSVAAGDVLANIFRTEPGADPSISPTLVTFDLTPFAGSTVRLRFASVSNAGVLAAAVDDVHIMTERVKSDTNTTVTANPSSIVFGQTVTFTAKVTPLTGEGIPTGIVTFKDGETTLGSPTLSGGVASIAVRNLSEGSHMISAVYNGDDNFNGSTGNLMFTVNKANSPPFVTAGPFAVNEGSSILLTASGSDPDGDTLTYDWDLDDDGIFETPGQNVLFNNTVDGPSSPRVRVRVTDDDGLFFIADAVVVVRNVAPAAVGNLILSSASIKENDSVTLSGAFFDPGILDSHTVIINWGDGSSNTMLSFAAGVFSYTAGHQYLDDNPSGTTSDLYNITVTLIDKDGGVGSSGTSVTVNNVAPTITIVSGPLDPITLGMAANLSVSFTDPGTADTYSYRIDWADQSISTGSVAASKRSFTVDHIYSSPGAYGIIIELTDDDGGTASTSFNFIVVYDPIAGYVTGGGFINSPVGAYADNPLLTGKANFGFVAKYQKGASVPSGNTEFQSPGFNFKSTSYDFLVIAGSKAQLKGSGTINKAGDYSFILTVTDGQQSGGGGIDRFKIKIIDKSTGRVVYDNAPLSSDDLGSANPQAIQGGSIVIHSDR
jgi:hypothetical protein